jgi:hypothetical protein
MLNRQWQRARTDFTSAKQIEWVTGETKDQAATTHLAMITDERRAGIATCSKAVWFPHGL